MLGDEGNQRGVGEGVSVDYQIMMVTVSTWGTGQKGDAGRTGAGGGVSSRKKVVKGGLGGLRRVHLPHWDPQCQCAPRARIHTRNRG